MSEFNRLEGSRYFDVESQTSFEVDHITQVRIAGIAGLGRSADIVLWRTEHFRGAVICFGLTECGFDVSG